MADLVVRAPGDSVTLTVAALELRTHLAQMTRDSVSIDHSTTGRMKGKGFRLEVQGDVPADRASELAWSSLDDAVEIDVSGGAGVIRGATERSVLLGVYRFLNEMGCRWLRPTQDGTFVPERPAHRVSASMETRPVFRHRMMLFDGAVSASHLEALVRWAPKLGFNEFFLQYRDGYAFFDRWYSAGRRRGSPSPFTAREAQAIYDRTGRLVKRLGLDLHAVGHSWTCDAFGAPYFTDDTPAPRLDPDDQLLYAQIDGVRGLNKGNPIFSNLCYSNPVARARVVGDVVRYSMDHPHVDVIHVWLADGINNHCECVPCQTQRPSDWYVRLLNEVDEALSAAGSRVRLSFVAYVDLLWPPERERILNPDRFLLLFAPITRTHTRPFDAASEWPAMETYVRNRVVPPRSPEGNLAHLRAWQEVFGGEAAIYEYHLWRDQYHDPAGISTARVLHLDVSQLGSLGLDGFATVQSPRTCFPTGLGLAVLAAAHWEHGRTFESIAADYFEHAFGRDGDLVFGYLESLSDAFVPAYLRDERPIRDAEAAESFRSIPKIIASFRPAIDQGVARADQLQSTSWEYLRHHAEICGQLASALRARAQGDLKRAERIWRRVRSIAYQREPQLESVFDVYLFADTLDHRIPHRYGDPGDDWFWRGDF
jgi:hypothetical protein